MVMKITFDKRLFLAFHNAKKALGSQSISFDENIKLFEHTYDIKFIDNKGPWHEDQLIFKSETDYFAFLMRWS